MGLDSRQRQRQQTGDRRDTRGGQLQTTSLQWVHGEAKLGMNTQYEPSETVSVKKAKEVSDRDTFNILYHFHQWARSRVRRDTMFAWIQERQRLDFSTNLCNTFCPLRWRWGKTSWLVGLEISRRLQAGVSGIGTLWSRRARLWKWFVSESLARSLM